MPKNNSIEFTEDSFRIIYSRFFHEIRNPLSIVQSEMQLLFERHPDVADYEEWDTIQDNLQYLQDLLKEFSDYSNAGKLFRNPTDLRSYLQDIATAVKPSMDYLGIAFSLQFLSDLPHLSIDRIKLRQVFLNLLRNAQDAVPKSGGQIKILAFQTDTGQTCIQISDNGCGILPEQLPNLFKPFVTYKENGSGLGLAIAAQIVEAHQGSLSVKSTPGKGTSFYILLS
ncbi:MAG: HAMP domain-containing histidine kinase [Blautia sp.]|nr:HAMP domain-containing histidine kinase [Blautia sp.]